MLLFVLSACLDPYPPAADYCEESADLFCDYYLRCDRMAADSLDACRTNFLETCNEVYEPRYVALEAEGKLRLSRDGLKACEAHLEQVTCEDQIQDLQGDCAMVWEGLVPAGGACGIGIESFVCDTDSTCVVGLDLCGTCQPYSTDGTCDTDHRCHDDESCIDGSCVPRGYPGDACGEDAPCLLGAWCDGGTCTRRTVVAVGETCDATHECAYSSACIGGECVQSALIGESCTASACASGWCDDGTCAAFKAEGESCTANTECLSLQCDGTCTGLVGACLD